ncbi:MAG: hypothetical protein HC822_09890 [Oscillochloris sp.]|nr:hypothetical protein [Oscillochloris sp.]
MGRSSNASVTTQMKIDLWGILTIGAAILAVAIAVILTLQRPVLTLDESAYLYRGAAIVDAGEFPPVPLSPGVSIVHAASYFFLRSLPLGLEYAGRVTLFIGIVSIFGLTYLTTRSLLGPRWGLAALLLLVVYAPLRAVLWNASGFLFSAALIGTFLLLIQLRHRTNRIAGWIALLATTLGIATLFRNDGFVIYAGMTLIILVLIMHQQIPLLNKGLIIVFAWVGPFVALISLATLASWATTGNSEIFPTGRTYVAFEQGAGLVQRFELAKFGLSPWVEGARIAAETFGTREENNVSVVTALTSNPTAWAQRVGWNIRDFFLRWYEDHEGVFALGFLILVIFGIVALMRLREWLVIAGLVVLVLPTGVYFIVTFWRQGYVATYSPLMVVLVCLALAQLINTREQAAPRLAVGGLLISLASGMALIIAVSRYSDAVNSITGPIGQGITSGEIFGVSIVLLALTGATAGWQWMKQTRRLLTIGLIFGLWMSSATTFIPAPLSVQEQRQARIFDVASEQRRSYIRFAYANAQDGPVCAADPSLPWYARQQVVITSELHNPQTWQNAQVLTELLKRRSCVYAFFIGQGAVAPEGFTTVWTEGVMVLTRPIQP